MIGTLINIATVLVGGVSGSLLGARFPERIRQTVVAGLGLFTLAYGFQMVLKTQNAIIVLGSILIGVLIGEWARIEDGLQWLGGYIEQRVMRGAPAGVTADNSRFIRGFLTASLLFCVGPMTILGSIQDGLTGDYQILVIKAVLDGFAALAFASSLGIGVLFSTLIILVYQGGLTLLAGQVHAFVDNAMMTEMTAAGGVIMMGIAISSLLEIKKIRVGNFIPALIIAPMIVKILALLGH